MKAKEMVKRRMGIGSSGLHLQLLAQYTLTVRLREVLRDRFVVRISVAESKSLIMSGGFWWIIGIMLTAGLASLGAPFWYDAISGISRSSRQK